MPKFDEDDRSESDRARQFATTHWSIVLAAGQKASPDSRQALATLCETYWYPLYAYVRRRGYPVHEAQDLTQEFFARILEKDYLRLADRQRGKFRSFLLAALDHFLANEWRRETTQKRGGGRPLLSLDFEVCENRYALEPAHELTPVKIYERRWALTMLERCLAKVREEFADGDRLKLFEHLKAYLGGDDKTVPYRQFAAELGMTEGAVKVAVHRLRRRCRDVVRAEIALTVCRPEDVDDELLELFNAVGPAKSPNCWFKPPLP